MAFACIHLVIPSGLSATSPQADLHRQMSAFAPLSDGVITFCSFACCVIMFGPVCYAGEETNTWQVLWKHSCDAQILMPHMSDPSLVLQQTDLLQRLSYRSCREDSAATCCAGQYLALEG